MAPAEDEGYNAADEARRRGLDPQGDAQAAENREALCAEIDRITAMLAEAREAIAVPPLDAEKFARLHGNLFQAGVDATVLATNIRVSAAAHVQRRAEEN